jgi:prolyl-tRNA synthetase
MSVVEGVKDELKDFRLHVDDRTEVTPGFKFNDWEMRGVPLRIEIGPRDVEKNSVAFARRDKPGREGKTFVSQDQLTAQVAEMLERIQASLYDRALAFRVSNTHNPKDYDELREVVKSGWAYSWWCGDEACEQQVKDDTKATTRCMPLDQPQGEGTCIVCNRPAMKKIYFARAY